MVSSPLSPAHFGRLIGDDPTPVAASKGPRACPASGGASAAPTAALLAILASQHEHLQQMVTEIAATLAEAHATVGQASGAFQGMQVEGKLRAGAPAIEVADFYDAGTSFGRHGPDFASADHGCVEAERSEEVSRSSDPWAECGPTDMLELQEDVQALRVELAHEREKVPIQQGCAANRRTSKLVAVAAGEHLSAQELLEEMADRGFRRQHSPEDPPRGAARRSCSQDGPHSPEGRRHSPEGRRHSLEGRRASQEGRHPGPQGNRRTTHRWRRTTQGRRTSLEVPGSGQEARRSRLDSWGSSEEVASVEDDILEHFDAGLGPGSEDWSQVRQNAIVRLQARLGKKSLKGAITPWEIHRAVRGLGLDKYELSDIKDWLVELQGEISMRESGHSRLQRMASIRHFKQRATNVLGLRWVRGGHMLRADGGDSPDAEVPLSGFVKLLLDDETLSTFRAEIQEMSLTIREVLFSGDANRLVAELTNVRVDEVAAPREKVGCLAYLEPVVAFMIVMNGLVIGLQLGSDEEGVNVWFWCNAAFTAFFLAEIVARVALVGLVQAVTGPDRWWNAFDVLMSVFAVFDLTFEAVATSGDVAPIFVLRILRLTRLTRLARIFRLRRMKELTLMLKGLLGGLHTLFWAVVLLFFTIYVIACIATAAVGRGELVPQIEQDRLFETVWHSFFTCFRCFLGDCTTSAGQPIAKLLSDGYGVPFTLAYFGSKVFVVFGIFNLIVAIYIENTLEAAKTHGEQSKAQAQRESVRIARATRQLLKKFCAVEGLWGDPQNVSAKEAKQWMSVANFADISGISATVSKDSFLWLIQDPSVQQLMDQLDIPPDRASLFDILDADGSGGLEVIELITGLLRIRGEARRSDVVATLLAVRAVQDMVRECTDRVSSLESMVSRTAEASPNTRRPLICSNTQLLKARFDGDANI